MATNGVCDPTAPAQLANPAASAAGWPEHSILELGALPGAVPCVRLHTTALLREWGMSALADAAELVASELATNAVQASSEPTSAGPASRSAGGLAVVSLHLASDRRQLLIEVGDSDPRPPAPASPDPERDGGRGLSIVEAVSARWGCYYLNPGTSYAGPSPKSALTRPGIKVVWALITP